MKNSRYKVTAFDKSNSWLSACEFQRSFNQMSIYINNAFKKGAAKVIYTDSLTGETITIEK